MGLENPLAAMDMLAEKYKQVAAILDGIQDTVDTALSETTSCADQINDAIAMHTGVYDTETETGAAVFLDAMAVKQGVDEAAASLANIKDETGRNAAVLVGAAERIENHAMAIRRAGG